MDELIKVIMKEVAKQTAQQNSSNSNVAPINHEVAVIKKKVTDVAKHIKMQFDQFVAVGFTEEQAMNLLIAIFNK